MGVNCDDFNGKVGAAASVDGGFSFLGGGMGFNCDDFNEKRFGAGDLLGEVPVPKCSFRAAALRFGFF